MIRRLMLAATSALLSSGLALSPAMAQDTIAVFGDAGQGLSRFIDTTSGYETFDVVVVVDPITEYRWVEFWITELTVLYPGIYRVGLEYSGSHPVVITDVDLGYYDVHPNWGGSCVTPGSVEIVRASYMDIAGEIGSNVVIAAAPWPPEGPYGASCAEGMCYGDCVDVKHLMTPVPWADFDVIDPTWIPGVENSDGVLVLNPDAIAVEGSSTSMGCLKARF